MNINCFLVTDLFFIFIFFIILAIWLLGKLIRNRKEKKPHVSYMAHPKHLAVTLTVSLFMFWYTSAMLAFSTLA